LYEEDLGKRYVAAVSFAVALVTLLVYLPAVTNDFVNWDDPVNIVNNVHIRSLDLAFFKWAFTETSLSYWQPLNWLTHAIDYSVWKLNPAGHHLTNILLHAITTFIVVQLVIRLIRFPSRVSGMMPFLDRGAVLVAGGVTGLLFGLHPLNVESVAWVTGRPGMLCTLFYLLSVFNYLGHAAVAGQNEPSPFAMDRQYILSLVFFVFSLASKPTAITLPVVLLLLDWYLTGTKLSLQRIRNVMFRTLPYFLLAVAISIVAVFSEKIYRPAEELMIVSLPDRLLVVAKALSLYLFKIAAPVDLIPYYEYPGEILFLTWEYLIPVFVVCGVTAICILLFRKQKILLVVWIYFIVTLLPVLGLVNVRAVYIADRYIYLSIIGPLLLLGMCAARLWQQYGSCPRNRWLMVFPATAVLLAMTFMTVKQVAVWKSSMNLWNHLIAIKPSSYPVAYQNRGVLFVATGEYDRAIEDSTQAIALAPDYHDAYHNRGNAYAGKGEYDRAIADYKKAISLRPDDAVLYSSLGLAYAGMGKLDLAVEAYGKSVALKRDYMEAYNNRGLAYAAMGELALAINDFNKADELKPGEASVYINRGLAFAGQGRDEQAELEYTAALKLEPAPGLAVKALSNRGMLRFNRRDYAAALSDFNAAAALGPDVVAVYYNRGTLYRVLGEHARAAEDFSRVLELDPEMVNAYLYRGDAYLQGGNPAAAKKDFIAACRMGSAAGCSRARSLKSAR
jgi:tetratricopeptide (TPR) repeat protein